MRGSFGGGCRTQQRPRCCLLCRLATPHWQPGPQGQRNGDPQHQRLRPCGPETEVLARRGVAHMAPDAASHTTTASHRRRRRRAGGPAFVWQAADTLVAGGPRHQYCQALGQPQSSQSLRPTVGVLKWARSAKPTAEDPSGRSWPSLEVPAGGHPHQEERQRNLPMPASP